MKRILASLALGAGLVASCGGRTSMGYDDDDFDAGGPGEGGQTTAGGGGAPTRGGAAPRGGARPRGGANSRGGANNRGGAAATTGGRPVSSGGANFGGAILVEGGRTSAGGRVGAGGRVSSGGATTSGGAITFGGATSGGAVGAGGGTVMCPGLAPNEELIDDINDGDPLIPRINGRAGAWTDAHDPTPGSFMFPDPAQPFVVSDTGEVCRRGAARVVGGPFSIWGAAFGFGLGSPYNAKQYRGLSFWVRAGVGSSTGLRVTFPDQFTHPNGGLCSPSMAGPTQCYDHYGKRFFATTSWTKVTVLFSELSQDGWGYQAPFDPSTLFEVSFQIPANAIFDLWVDDVAFLL